MPFSRDQKLLILLGMPSDVSDDAFALTVYFLRVKEIDTSWHDLRGHLKLPPDDLRRDLYRLFTHFHASDALAALANKDTGAFFARLQKQSEELEIQTLLLSVAVRIRILDEAYNEASTEKWSLPVGKLFADSTDKSNVPLSLREACSKIIHARLVNFCRSDQAAHDEVIFPLMPRVVIYGSRSRSAIIWRAELEIDCFVKAALGVAEYVYAALQVQGTAASKTGCDPFVCSDETKLKQNEALNER